MHLSISSPRGCLRLQKVSDLSVPGNSAQKQLCCFSKKNECRKGQKKLDAASVTRTHDLQIGIRRIEVLLQSDDLPANLWPQLVVENCCVIFSYAGHCVRHGMALASAPHIAGKCLSPARRHSSKDASEVMRPSEQYQCLYDTSLTLAPQFFCLRGLLGHSGTLVWPLAAKS